MSYSFSFSPYFDIRYDNFKTIGAAIAAAKKTKADEKAVYIGECDSYTPKIDTLEILKDVYNKAADKCGPFAAHYMQNLPDDITNELEQELNTVFNDWQKRHNLPLEINIRETFNIKKYSL